MRDRLAKLSCVSDRIRKRSLQKRASVTGKALELAAKHPLQTGIAALGVVGATGTYKKHKAQFDPEVSKRMMGQPLPPLRF